MVSKKVEDYAHGSGIPKAIIRLLPFLVWVGKHQLRFTLGKSPFEKYPSLLEWARSQGLKDSPVKRAKRRLEKGGLIVKVMSGDKPLGVRTPDGGFFQLWIVPGTAYICLRNLNKALMQSTQEIREVMR